MPKFIRDDVKKKNTVCKYRILMQDIESKFSFAIFIETIGNFNAKHSALTEFPFAEILNVKEVI